MTAPRHKWGPKILRAFGVSEAKEQRCQRDGCGALRRFYVGVKTPYFFRPGCGGWSQACVPCVDPAAKPSNNSSPPEMA